MTHPLHTVQVAVEFSRQGTSSWLRVVREKGELRKPATGADGTVRTEGGAA